MSELTAQIVQRGRGPSSEEAGRRRLLAREMRAAREKLTSETGLERAFDYELVRLFARSRSLALVPILVLAATVVGAMAMWISPRTGACWGAAVLVTALVPAGLGRWFLSQDAGAAALPKWRRRFMAAAFLHGAAWACLVPVLAHAPVPSARTFVLLILVIAAATTTMLAAAIPAAAYAGLLPIALASASLLVVSHGMDGTLLVVTATAAQVFLVLLANHLYAATVATLQSRAEKDAIFAELEQAKANSDEARRRAEEANLAKSRFLATMSHELRTPLNAILGFSEVMKNEIFGPHAANSYREYSTDIHDSGMHLLDLINEILDLSRIEAGRYDLQEEALQLSHLVEECHHMLALRARGKNQMLRELVDPSLPRLWADERAMRQIVLNVLSNAIKFTPPGGEITIKVGWTSSGGQYFSVRDTGPGIPESEMATVMSSFGRGSLAIKTAEEGSGLGLPIVKGLVDLHGGGFQLVSRPREGTEVIVTLPAARVIDALPAVMLEGAAPPPAPSARAARAA